MNLRLALIKPSLQQEKGQGGQPCLHPRRTDKAAHNKEKNSYLAVSLGWWLGPACDVFCSLRISQCCLLPGFHFPPLEIQASGMLYEVAPHIESDLVKIKIKKGKCKIS